MLYFRETVNFAKATMLNNTEACLTKQPPEVFYKKGVLENFSKFTEIRLCQSLIFNIFLRSEACNFIHKETLDICFPVNFAKLLRTPFLQNTFGLLLPIISGC